MAGAPWHWRSSVATLSTAATVISTGLLADRLGRRRVLMVGLLIAALGDLMVALAAHDVDLPPRPGHRRRLVSVPCSARPLAYIRAVANPESCRPPSVSSLRSSASPRSSSRLVGGSLAGIDWRLAFLVAPAMSLVCFVLVPLVLPKEARVWSDLDRRPRQVLLIVGIIAFLYGVSELGRSLTSPGPCSRSWPAP